MGDSLRAKFIEKSVQVATEVFFQEKLAIRRIKGCRKKPVGIGS
jgi:hypothetical protein